jgi:triosephosphate isomerase (TIM)
MATTTGPRRLVGFSTKMYFSIARTKEYVDAISKLLSESPDLLRNTDIFMIPDHAALALVAIPLRESNILLGAQNSFYEDHGAFTGEVSPAALAELGCRIVELGHAERRRLFGETDEIVARKAAAAIRNGMIPLICIGDRTKGEVIVAVEECRSQVEAVMKGLPDTAEVVLAYEPVWAIGASKPASAEYVVSVVREIKALECIRQRRGLVRVVYGGSAGPGLFAQLKDGVDGLFLGRFAHDPAQFYKTIQEVSTS